MTFLRCETCPDLDGDLQDEPDAPLYPDDPVETTATPWADDAEEVATSPTTSSPDLEAGIDVSINLWTALGLALLVLLILSAFLYSRG